MNELSKPSDWDAVWDGIRLPAEVKRDPRKPFVNILCDCFDRYLPHGAGISALEIGGAPGQYLAYMHRSLGYKVSCLDYSDIGCRKATENASLLGMPLQVMQGDFLDPQLVLPPFDVVYSLGLIEHFSDLDAVIRHHLRFLKPGGTLMVGCPNLQGINLWFKSCLAPASLAIHNTRVPDISTWTGFETAYRLETVFKGYVGGFEPGPLTKCEVRTWKTFLVRRAASLLDKIFRKHLRWLRRYNSPWFSGYALGVYKFVASSGSSGHCLSATATGGLP